MLDALRKVVMGSDVCARIEVPVTPQAAAAIMASLIVRVLWTRGWWIVHFILASRSFSKIWLKAKANNEHSAVPRQQQLSVMEDSGPLAARKPAAVIATTKLDLNSSSKNRGAPCSSHMWLAFLVASACTHLSTAPSARSVLLACHERQYVLYVWTSEEGLTGMISYECLKKYTLHYETVPLYFLRESTYHCPIGLLTQ